MPIPYVIHNWHTPGMYWPSGGARALVEIRRQLELRGHEVRYQWENPSDDAIWLFSESRYMVARDHPAKRKCYFFGNKEANPLISKDECRFVWLKAISDDPVLNVNIFELDLWKPYGNKTETVGYWIGKGAFDPSLVPPGAIEVNRDNFRDRTELARFISSCDYFISFDPMTAIVTEATFAGTPVLIHNIGHSSDQPGWTNEEVKSVGWNKYGIAYSPEEMDFARKTVHLAKGHYKEIMKTFPKTIDNFIKITQERFA